MVRKQNSPASGARFMRRPAAARNALLRRIALAVPLALAAVALSMVLSVPRAYAGPVEDLGNAFMQFFGLAEEPAPAAAFDETAVADPSTVTSWEAIAGQNTQNIGRIWTDKSVSTEDVKLPASPAGNAPWLRRAIPTSWWRFLLSLPLPTRRSPRASRSTSFSCSMHRVR